MVRQARLGVKKAKNRKKKHLKFHLLLDEGLSPPYKYKKLNNRHQLHHVTYEREAPHDDVGIYNFAKKKGWHLVVFNKKHFRKQVKSNDPICVFLLSGTMKEKEIENKLLKFLDRATNKSLCGKHINISNETGKK